MTSSNQAGANTKKIWKWLFADWPIRDIITFFGAIVVFIGTAIPSFLQLPNPWNWTATGFLTLLTLWITGEIWDKNDRYIKLNESVEEIKDYLVTGLMPCIDGMKITAQIYALLSAIDENNRPEADEKTKQLVEYLEQASKGEYRYGVKGDMATAVARITDAKLGERIRTVHFAADLSYLLNWEKHDWEEYFVANINAIRRGVQIDRIFLLSEK